MTAYIAILDGSDDVWGVCVPDVPGCHGGGATAETAIADAASAQLELTAEGITLRSPRALRDIVADRAAEALVVLNIAAGRKPRTLATV